MPSQVSLTLGACDRKCVPEMKKARAGMGGALGSYYCPAPLAPTAAQQAGLSRADSLSSALGPKPAWLQIAT